jgi:hypothetical protein
MVAGRTVIAAVCWLALSGAGLHAASAQTVDYARDVLPILSEKCYKCHGPEETDRQKDLRLDLKEGAFRVEEGVAVIVPGKPDKSELVRRISSKDPDEVMPPSDDLRKLSAQQIETLRRWVEQGAKWGTHWAFVAPDKPQIPAGGNPIDAFVRARLNKEKLSPAPEADKATLIRRVTFDLTGLPPTSAEIDAFIADSSPNAYEKLLDRLLASPHYGERMASDWLDVARFADTHGYQMDRYRPMWPWRDWVIKAFNSNLPFDQFLTWQLAGDLLPNATKEQRLATAFNRLHMQNEEGGVVEEEFRVAYVVDRVTTAGTAFLGLTFECSRCHDHKYDPITQRDFYSLFAFFQNIDESGQTSYFTDATPTPAMLLSSDEQDAKLAGLRSAAAAKEKQLAAVCSDGNTEFERWLASKRAMPADVAGMTARFTFDEPPPPPGTQPSTQPVANAIDPKHPGVAVEGPRAVEGRFGKAAELSGENGFTFPASGDFQRADPFSLSIWLQTPSLAPPRMVVVHKSKAPIDAASRGYELLLENGRVAFGLHHFWPGNSLKVVTKRTVSDKKWTHVAVTYNGSSRADGVRIYIDGEPAEFDIVRDGLSKDIRYGGKEPDLAIGYRFRDNGFKGGKVDDFRIFNRAVTPLEVTRLAGKDDAFAAAWNDDPNAISLAHRDALREYFFANVDAGATKLAQELTALRRQENELATSIPEAMVMREMPTTKPAFVLERGSYDKPKEPVSAATPAFLPSMPKDQPRNRLGLARWMLADDNPLTSRVVVNRVWQQMFGRGIVETTENFGTQGAQPTHPELLDWLAREFSGPMHWDTKRLLKTIAMSATYRQSSLVSSELLSREPANTLLARGPSRRLTAEMLRDQALSVSGLLVEKIGGPSVKPYQPDGIWDVAMGRPKYDTDTGEGLYRRSLYTFWKRSVPPPSMTMFDAADKNYCTVRRQSTSTPLQALALLNDTQVAEAARFVAQRMLAEGGATTDARIAWAFRVITGRTASDRELVVLKRLFAEQHELFLADPGSAAKLLEVGAKRNDTKYDRADLAAGTVLGIALFNHDSTVMRR